MKHTIVPPSAVSDWKEAINLMVAMQKKHITWREYDLLPKYKQIFRSLFRKKPINWDTNIVEGYMNRFVDCAQKSFAVGKRIDYNVDNDNRSFHIGIRYDADSFYPVISATFTYKGMVFQERKFITHHGVTDWGIRAPYDEFGLSGRPNQSYIDSDEVAKKGYSRFDNIVNSVERQIVSAFNS